MTSMVRTAPCVLLTASVLICGCATTNSSSTASASGGARSQRVTTGNQAGIAASLEEILTKPEGGSVVFEDKESGRYVQFTGSASEPLTLDLPTQNLSESELARARTLFASNGGSEDASGLHLNLGRDADRGAQIASKVFSDVFHSSRPLGAKPTARD